MGGGGRGDGRGMTLRPSVPQGHEGDLRGRMRGTSGVGEGVPQG